MRTWTNIGRPYTDGEGQAEVGQAIDRLEWVSTEGRSFPMIPGEAIKAVIRELRMPSPRRVAISSDLAPLGLYGIESQYRNGLARVYVVDAGSRLVPVASDFGGARRSS